MKSRPCHACRGTGRIELPAHQFTAQEKEGQREKVDESWRPYEGATAATIAEKIRDDFAAQMRDGKRRLGL